MSGPRHPEEPDADAAGCRHCRGGGTRWTWLSFDLTWLLKRPDAAMGPSREYPLVDWGRPEDFSGLIGSSSEQLVAALEQAYEIGLAHITATTPAIYRSEQYWAHSPAILGLDQGTSSPDRSLGGCELPCPPIVPQAYLHKRSGLGRRVHSWDTLAGDID